MALLLDLALLGLLAGLLGLDRRAAFQLMLSQPVVTLPLLGLVFGELSTALWLGCLLQLLWTTAVLFGASTPLNETVGATCVGGMALLYGAHLGPLDDALIALSVLLGAPLATLGQRVDQHLDRAGLRLAARADAAAEAADLRALAAVGRAGLLRTFAAHAGLVIVGTGLGLGLLWLLHLGLTPTLTVGLTAFTRYILPALGLAVALAAVRRRRGLALGGLLFVTLVIALGGLDRVTL